MRGVDAGANDPSDPCLHIRIGDISVAVRSDLPGLLEDVAELYPAASRSAAPLNTIQMQVRRTGSRFGRQRYRIYGDGEEIGGERYRKEVFPFLEWGINLRVIATCPQFVQLHAASMAHRGSGFVFAGESGCGKSTLAAGLLARGWEYLCDEFALIDRRTLRLQPLPKPLCIKEGSFSVIKRLGLSFTRRRDYIKSQKGRVGYINPDGVEARTVARSAPVRFVVFPKFAENQPPRLYPVSRIRALTDLAGCVFNQQAFSDHAFSVLAQVIQGAECFRLESGDIQETCDLLEARLCQTPALAEPIRTPVTEAVAKSPNIISTAAASFPSRREMLRHGVKLAYVVPTVVTLTAREAFAAASITSGFCSTGVHTGGLCETDADCCTRVCNLGVCK